MRVVVKDSGFETCWWGFEKLLKKYIDLGCGSGN
jgi:hypothetical protein